MTLLSGSSTVEIAAPIERCWSIVENVLHWPDWQHLLEAVDVVDRDDHGRPITCDTVADARFTKVRCRVAVTYEPPHRIYWRSIESEDVDALQGSWVLEPLGADLTRVTYELAVDPGPVGLLGRPLERMLRPLVVGRRAEELARVVNSPPHPCIAVPHRPAS